MVRQARVRDGKTTTSNALEKVDAGREWGSSSGSRCTFPLAHVIVTGTWHDGLVRAPLVSYIDRLRSELAEIQDDMHALIDGSTIRNVNPNTRGSSVVFVGAADWGWGPSDADLTAMQMRLAAIYGPWFDRFELLFPHPTPQVAAKLREVHEFTHRWVTRPETWDHAIPQTIELAKARAKQEFAKFEELLDIASKAGTDEVRLVPDTNALIRNPDIGSYARMAPSQSFHVHLLPTVLSELDDLKDRGRTQELRDQAQAVVRRLKGLRDKGNLATGVSLTKRITVRAEAREVDVQGVLNWLDPSVPDDRLLAAALRLQSDNPAGSVVLVTSDLNLQNKADAVGLPYMETPPRPASLRAGLRATLNWPTELGPPVVTLVNDGPADARHVTYSVSTPPDAAPPHSRAGPWDVDQMKPGQDDRQQVYGFYSPVVLVTAGWTDDDGSHELSWAIDFPERPPRQSLPGRGR